MRNQKIHVIRSLFVSTLEEEFSIDLVRLLKFHSAGKVFILNQRENAKILKLLMGRKFRLSHFISSRKKLNAQLNMAVIPDLQNTASIGTST